MQGSRNQREGHYFGKVNGSPRRVKAAMRAGWRKTKRHKKRFNFQFGPARR